MVICKYMRGKFDEGGTLIDVGMSKSSWRRPLRTSKGRGEGIKKGLHLELVRLQSARISYVALLLRTKVRDFDLLEG